MTDFSITAALVRSILERASNFVWTVQGFGFIRTKIADIGRIHVWDSTLATPRVSTVHTHPWPLQSTIISGELLNQRFTEDTDYSKDVDAYPYQCSEIATGEGGGLLGTAQVTYLIPSVPEPYGPKGVYFQEPFEIHRTQAQDGTVTLLQRPQGPPLEKAMVFWPQGTVWVSAEPKPIAGWELSRAITYALDRWNAL